MKITMIGAGQQGVSQGLAFAQLSSVAEVVFYDVSLDAPEILAKAQAFNVDPMKIRFAASIEEAQHGADVTAINVPMSVFENIAYEVARHTTPNTILYDNGSGKTQAIVDIQAGLARAKQDGANIPQYVPAHFFVGRAGTGPQLADVNMYRGGTAALISDGRNDAAIQLLKSLFEAIGVKNVRTDLSARDHDESLGFYSHHNTFFQGSLMRAFSQTEIAGHTVDIGTFLGSTRVAETGKDGLSMWGPIAVDNANAIVSAGNIVVSKLELLDRALDEPTLLAMHLEQAHDYAISIPENRPAENIQGDLHDLRRQENPVLSENSVGDADISDTLRPYIASHVAMPVAFAAASVLGAMEYEKKGGQPFLTIGNSSFYGTMRPLRNQVEDMTILLSDNKEEVRMALRRLTETHRSLLVSIEHKDRTGVKAHLDIAQNARSHLPRERTPDQIRPAFTIS